MNPKRFAAEACKWSGAGFGLAGLTYAAYAGLTFLRYGRPKRAVGVGADPVLDLFMPDFDIVERHRVRAGAPAEVALAAAAEIDLQSSALVRGIFKGRELMMCSKPDQEIRPSGFLALTKSLGWGVLAELPGREIVMGAVTKPWEANPEFRALPPDEFAAFDEPGYVKIAWTLRADPLADGESMFRTETRAIATDVESRRKFRRYWALLSPGIILLRTVMLGAVKAEAGRRWRHEAVAA